jgi:hypothetical protein
MKKSNLKPFIRNNLEILFVGLNPAEGSSENKHYFSVNQSFWNQLYFSGLITKMIDKSYADEIVFGTQTINFNGWFYGITDLVVDYAESSSRKIKPTDEDCSRLKNQILLFKPKVVVIIHQKVLRKFMKFLGRDIPSSNSGYLGKLISNSDAIFFNIAFPHGNYISSEEKIREYKKLKQFIQNKNQL